jgi:hypothetical protein
MGCGGSKGSNDGLIAELRAALEQEQLRSAEQQNLLRFKIEVMVNMLAMEEKKNDATSKRLETLKWVLLQQGISEQKLLHILSQQEKNGDSMGDSAAKFGDEIKASKSLIDLSGAISRTSEEFGNFRNDIIYSFADNTGKIVNCLTTDQFMRQLFTVTENLSKADIQVCNVSQITYCSI